MNSTSAQADRDAIATCAGRLRETVYEFVRGHLDNHTVEIEQ